MVKQFKIVKPIIKYKYIIDNYNAIEYINRIAREHPVKGIIIDLAKYIITKKRIPKELFTDSIHYELYRQYFKGYPFRLVISSDYLLVDNLIPVISSINRCRYYCDSEGYKDMYTYLDRWVFGINSDSRVFVNHLRRERGIKLSKHIYWSENGCVEDSNTGRYICVIVPNIEYAESWRIRFDYLGYDIDTNNEENISIVLNGAYRVQGEVLFGFIYMDYERIINTISQNIVNQLRSDINRIVNTYLLIKIRNYLSQYGFTNMETGNLDVSTLFIRIRNCITKAFYKNNKDKIVKALRMLRENIYQYISNDILPDKTIDNVIYIRDLLHIRDNYVDIDIEIESSYTRYWIDIYNYIKEYTLKSIRDLVENRVYKEYTVYHNNHLIKIQSIPLEYSIDIPSELNPLKQLIHENDIVLNANLRNNTVFYVLPGFKANIQHHQHGITNITFEKPGAIQIFDTRISLEHLDFQNRIAFKNMINQLLNNNNNKNNRKITEYVNGVE